MNKNVFIIMAVLIIAIGGYFLFNQSAPQNVVPANEQADSLTEKDIDEATAEEAAEQVDDEATAEDDGSVEDNEAMAEVKTFDLTGKNFEFSLKEIRVKQGDTVRINFTSADGFHDWTVDEFSAQTDQVQTRDSSFVEFVADQAGTFEFYCSVGQHRQLGMVGKLVVE